MTSREEFRKYRSAAHKQEINIHVGTYSDVPLKQVPTAEIGKHWFSFRCVYIVGFSTLEGKYKVGNLYDKERRYGFYFADIHIIAK